MQRRVWSADIGTTNAPDQLERRWTATLTTSPEARFRALVATAKGQVVGYAVVHPGADPGVDPVVDAEVAELAVDPGARGAGHGSRLLQAVVDTLVADGFTVARCWVRTDDDAMRRFLTSAGWAADGAHRELESESGERLRQVRLHTSIG
jgi:ribosomal protein S18 acetylase RimI-like enzyme